jgi:uncharacterized membrane protein
MESRSKLFGHPVHPMLIVLPVGLFLMAVISDSLFLITRSSIFPVVSFINIAGGVIGGLLAAIFGFRDYLAIPTGTRAKSIAATHGVGNVIVVVLFAVSWLIRNGDDSVFPSSLALIFSFLGIIVAAGTAWLGGELVDRLGVGVDPGANLNAPSSLSGGPASAVIDRAPAFRTATVPVTGDEQHTQQPNREDLPRGAQTYTHDEEQIDKTREDHDLDEP